VTLHGGEQAENHQKRNAVEFEIYVTHSFQNALVSKIIKNPKHGTVMSSHVLLLLLWRFDPIQGHSPVLRASAITLIGHITLGRTSLDG
jgi:hypothetical protein